MYKALVVALLALFATANAGVLSDVGLKIEKAGVAVHQGAIKVENKLLSRFGSKKHHAESTARPEPAGKPNALKKPEQVVNKPVDLVKQPQVPPPAPVQSIPTEFVRSRGPPVPITDKKPVGLHNQQKATVVTDDDDDDDDVKPNIPNIFTSQSPVAKIDNSTASRTTIVGAARCGAGEAADSTNICRPKF